LILVLVCGKSGSVAKVALVMSSLLLHYGVSNALQIFTNERRKTVY
jgi:hypothetical protein